MERRIIIDSDLSHDEAVKQNPKSICPQDIFDHQQLVKVQYFSFDNKLHQGQIVVHEDLTEDIKDLFARIKDTKFPVTSVIPISDSKYNWDDNASMDSDNTSGFNYRTVMGTKRLSNHALGRAIDINPRLNPYYPESGGIQPTDATYEPSKPGTLSAHSEITLFLKKKGWEWGGDWQNTKDYQHFQKPAQRA